MDTTRWHRTEKMLFAVICAGMAASGCARYKPQAQPPLAPSLAVSSASAPRDDTGPASNIPTASTPSAVPATIPAPSPRSDRGPTEPVPTATATVQRSDQNPPTPARTTSSRPHYGLNLPKGPVTAGSQPVVVYEKLRVGTCSSAQAQLDSDTGSGPFWATLQNPSFVLIMQAGISACRGDLAGAQRLLDRNTRLVGPSGLTGDWSPCYLYKALRSVLQQVPQSSVSCPQGPTAQWPVDPATGELADPREDPYPPLLTSPTPSSS